MNPRRKQSVQSRAVKRTLLLVVFLFVFYYLVIPTLARSRESADLLTQVNPLLVILAIAFEVVSLLCYSVLTRVTLPAEPRLSLFTILRIQMSTKAVGNLVPGGSAAGGTLGYSLLTDAGVSSTAAGFTLASVGLGSAVVLNLILWVALLISIPLNGFRTAYVTAAIVGVLLLAFAAGLVYLLIEGRDQAERVLRAIARKVPYVDEDTAARFVHQAADRIQDLARQPELVRRGALWATANWMFDIAALWVMLRAFGYTMNPINLIVAYGVTGVVASIPITPGGLGVVETALPSLLVTFGAPVGPAGFAVLAWRLIQFWMPIPLGGLSYASLKLGPLGRRRRLTAVRTMARDASENARVRVWDQETGEYRMVKAETAEALLLDADPHEAHLSVGELEAELRDDLEEDLHEPDPDDATPPAPEDDASATPEAS
ncbi:lysylphosphatidylglycerol synthase transmembrane domain-containing protein [Aquihabitans sp. McL0605]|uniref:lysylphosphatidylglycerol synthase transmembrane domain-containing protein n=1 Tax=Aquihabitans sp. McL0605 TaxID=3415671 RepID=UPI003CF7F4E2